MSETEAQRDNDSLCTPAWILDLVRKMGPILLDPCSNQWSNVNAVHSITHVGDGLSYDWPTVIMEDSACHSGAALAMLLRRSVTYVNPPYSKPAPWVNKCAESARSGMQILALLKNDPSTKWFRTAMVSASARCDFSKRITFDGGAHKSGKLASTMFYWGQSPYLFCHLFAPHGDVFVLRK